MIDSSGKVPSGLMQYHLHDLGHFQECLNIDLENKSPYPVQHCVLQIGNLMRLPKAPHVDTETFETFFASLPVLKPRLHLGLCLPASCTLDDIKENYKQIVKKYNLTVHLENYSCTASNESQQFTTYDVIVSIVLAVPIILCLLATFIDSKFFTEGNQGIPKKMLNCFSLYKNGKNLLKTDSSKRPLSSLNGIRFLLMVWSTFTHHWMFRCVIPTLNYSEMSKMFQKFYVSPIISGSLSVDTFILISGILLPYAFLHGAKKGEKFNLRKFYQHRIVRIVPFYFFLLLGVTANYGLLMCDGPLCKYYLTKQRENCLKNWWTNVLFINNYVNVESQCLGHTWYLATDIQLRLIAPIFLLAFFKYKSLIKFGIPICIVIGCIIAFSTSFINQFSAGTLLPVDFRTVHKFWEEHITTQNKLGPWFVGMGLGYILFESEEKRFKISSFVAKLCWLISILVGGTVLMSMMYFHQEDVPYNRLMSSSYTGLHSTLWSLSVAWVIFALETGHGDLLRKIFAWKLFQPLAKLVFCMYLLHPILQYETNALRKTSAYTEITFLNMTILGELFTLILILPFFTLIYEIPFIGLEKVLLDYFKTKKKEIDDNNDTHKIGLSKI